MSETKEKNNLTLLSIVLSVGITATVLGISGIKDYTSSVKGSSLVGEAISVIDSNQKTCPTPEIASNLDGLVSISGCYSLFLSFPKSFFHESEIPRNQVVAVTDAQYLSLRKMHNRIAPYSFTKITYDPKVYGATTPEGIALGDAAFPTNNEGNPRWELMAHEQGHNFFGGTSAFYGMVAFGHPFLQESFAVLSAFFTYHNIIDDSKNILIHPKTIKSLKYDFENGRKYQESQYNLYLSLRKPFDIDDVLTSQVLDYKMITYGEKYGWVHYTKFTKAFEEGISAQFIFHHDGTSAAEQSTYVIAALGAAFKRDFRADFRKLNFPIDEVLYTEIYPKIKSYIWKRNDLLCGLKPAVSRCSS